MRIVGVHGVGNYRAGEPADVASQHLAAVWRKHLRRGPLGGLADSFDLEVAYYADQLRVPGRQGGDGGLDDIEPDAEELIRQWFSALSVPSAVGMGPGTWPLRQAIAWIAERRHLAPRMVELFISRFFSEVAGYLRGGADSPRTHARDEVARALRSRPTTIVLAHSLGSVVTYEALWAHPELDVELLVTLGSPLALPGAVFPRLLPAPETDRGRRPPGVRRWINLADPGDLVALPPYGLSQRFVDVDADEHNIIHAFDFHLVANYLACRRLAETLRDYVTA
jgi:hypothetical protein